jgi:hypothetical protein
MGSAQLLCRCWFIICLGGYSSQHSFEVAPGLVQDGAVVIKIFHL